MSLPACRLIPQRRGWCLSQKQLASLIPKCGRNRIRNLEYDRAEPSAAELIACELIFGLPASALFPRLYEETVESVMQGAHAMHEKYQYSARPKAKRRMTLVQSIKERAITDLNQTTE